MERRLSMCRDSTTLHENKKLILMVVLPLVGQLLLFFLPLWRSRSLGKIDRLRS
ncbi:hypothetical protein BGZ83_003553, partial [Gryganskiella cystojenkinii]